jgi:hypothetical protein
MFGLDFLFAAALFALPLASAPLLLHLLFKRKSKTVPFSTLRFIRQSLQQTAARRRLQRWLLLACRILLLALLIWAIAQPVKRLQASWTAGSHSTIAAIVVDTSYSMQLKEADVSLLSRADRAVQELLRTELSDARVALFTANDKTTSKLAPATALLSQWAALMPQVSSRPLADRIAAARTMLAQQPADQKWLVVLSDLQSREFPRPLENDAGFRTVLIDLHPDTPRSAGITSVAMNPPQPIPGVGSELVIDVTGRSGESRAVSIQLKKPDGTVLAQPAPVMANLNAAGRAALRLPIKLPPEPWLLADARFAESDSMPWDDSRATLISLPPRQLVRVIDQTGGSTAAKFVRLALDPNEGKLNAWPLDVRSGEMIGSDDRVAVVLLSHWPDQTMLDRLDGFVRAGHSLILFLQPGMESTWRDLPDPQRAAWLRLLPSAPSDAALTAPAHLVPAGVEHSMLSDLLAELDLASVQVRRMVRFENADRSVTSLLSISHDTSQKSPLLLRRAVGEGQVFTFATLPDSRFTNLATHPLFLPMLVRLALQSTQRGQSLNTEIGQPIVWQDIDGKAGSVTIESPAHEMFQVTRGDANKFTFSQTTESGLYTWRSENKVVAYSNLEPPAAESDLVYRPSESILAAAPNVLVARSLEELRSKMTQLAQPEPKWSLPMALVLILLCVEALLGSLSSVRHQTRTKTSTPAIV